jgi:predicted O-methyltransferase YrrM
VTLVHHIRPYKLFTVLEGSPEQRVAQTMLPYRRGGGGVSMLETMLITACSLIVNAKKLFEIGTFLGATTYNLALNAPDDAIVYTLDLGEQDAAAAVQDAADAPLTGIHLASQDALAFQGTGVERKFKRLTGNSVTYDFSRWKDSIDLTFIDGGHDYATVKADTENALAIARKDKPSCVLWHDYGNKDYSGLTGYLDALSLKERITHIQDTMLCIWFNDAAGGVAGKMLASDC